MRRRNMIPIRNMLAIGLLSAVLAVGNREVVHAQSAHSAQSAQSAQSAKEREKDAILAFFANLEGGLWRGVGEWSGGRGQFEQVHGYEWALDGRIVRSQTLIPDSAGAGYTVRSEGVRAWDEEAGVMRFWEFDRYGGITTGRVGVHDGALYYEYPYAAGGATLVLRDEWRRRDDGTFDYRVGAWQDGTWGQIFLTAVFSRMPSL